MSRHNLCRGRFLGLDVREGWEFATRVNAHAVVVLVPLTQHRELILVEQYRPPVECIVVELPAGLVGDQGDPEESLADAARRELEEETGYTPGTLSELLTCPSSSGMSDELVTFWLAGDLVQTGSGGGDDSEDITVYRIPLADIDDWLSSRIAKGHLVDPKIYAALYWLQRIEAGYAAVPPAGSE